MAFWLMKSEPDEASIDDLVRLGSLAWTGVRNYQARNFMRDQMQIGDGVLFYHSSCPQPGVAGLAEVVSAAVPDETQFDPASPWHDPKSTRESPRWLQRGREAGEEDPAAAAGRDAQRARTGHDGGAAARQPAVDHAGDGCRVARRAGAC
jgi:predicted RNA-binding protein with PUA-like domain